MTRIVPSAKQMEDSRQTHYFRDDNGDHWAVITELLPNGEYVAWHGDSDGEGPQGFGDTMIDAIADLHITLSELRVDLMPKSFEHLEPTRRLININDGQWLIGTTPPGFIGGKEVVVKLTGDQFRRYKQWLKGHGLIQDCLPDLNDSDREKLITGLNDEAFAEACGLGDD